MGGMNVLMFYCLGVRQQTYMNFRILVNIYIYNQNHTVMKKRILLLLSLAVSYTTLLAQIEHNTTGILGLGYKIDAAGPMAESVLPGSPAYVAGVQKNDRLLKINDQSLAGISIEALTEKFKIPMGVSIKILVEHEDKTQQEVVLKKAAYFSASYKVFRYMIFFDENNKPVYKPDQPCIWGDDCYNGYGYYAYSATEAFCGEFENGNRKEGLYYYVENGKPFYYLGTFSNNKYSGNGTLTYPDDKNQTMVYTGDFVNGNPESVGSIKNLDDGHVFTGSFKAGKKEGYGKETKADGTLITEGQWKNGVFQNGNNTLNEDWSGLSDEEIIKKAEKALLAEKNADSLERASIQAQLNEYYAKQKAAAAVAQTNSGSSSSAVDVVAESLKINNDNNGRSLYESFDVGISKYQSGQCFTGCSEYKRYIYVLVEENIPGFNMTQLFVNEAPQRGDLPPNISPRDDPKNYFDWGNLGNVNGINIFYQGINLSEIHSACTYQWELFSADEQKHYAKILVFGAK